MKKLIFFLIYCLFFSSCEEINEHNINVIKKATLDVHPSVHVGEAFDSYKYFKRTKWFSRSTKQGREAVIFEGYYYNDDGKYIITIEFIMNKTINENNNEVDFEVGDTGYKRQGEESVSFRKFDVVGAIFKNQELYFY